MRKHRRLSRRQTAAIGAAAVVLVVLCTAALLAFSLTARNGDDSQTGSESTAPPTGTATFDRTRAAQINDALAARDRTRLQEVVAIPARSSISDAAVAAVAEALPLDFDLSTVRYSGADTATVTARAGDSRTTWRIYLLLVDSAWKIAVTEQQTS